jgi:hypothetical protein
MTSDGSAASCLSRSQIALAVANRRSVNSEAIECLRIALAGRSERDVGGYLARARMVRERGAAYVTDEQIDRARREGRA